MFCSTSCVADRRTKSFTFNAAKKKIFNSFTCQNLGFDEILHSLFLSIADCKGLESTMAFGGETLFSCFMPLNEAASFKWVAES